MSHRVRLLHDDEERDKRRRTFSNGSIELFVLFTGAAAATLTLVITTVLLGLLIWNVSTTNSIKGLTKDIASGDCPVEDIGVYDYIFLGGGSTASTAVRRIMDAHPEVKILVLESGKYRNNDAPVYNALEFLTPWTDPRYSKGILSLPDANLFGQQVAVQTGNMIGGCGNHDFMQVFYSDDDYLDTQWGGLGGSFWNASRVRDRLRRSETFLGTPSALRGTTGPLSVLQIEFEPLGSVSYQMANLVSQAFAADPDVQYVDDYNLGQTKSVTTKAQQWWRPCGQGCFNRSSPGLDYLGPIINADGSGIAGGYENLTVMTESLVDRVLFTSDRRAYAVLFTDSTGVSRRVRASKEIIISAGAVYSPGILERSGYGNSTLLESLGIKTVYNNPLVGEQMKNQPSPLFAFNTDATLFNPFAFVSFQALLSVLPEAGGTRSAEIFASAAFAALLPPTARALLGSPPPAPSQTIAAFSFLLIPKSEGSIHIVSSMPAKEPAVIHNTYTDDTNFDLRVQIESMRSLKRLVDLQAAQDGAHTYTVIYPNQDAWDDASNTTLAFQIQAANVYAAHWTQTCLMGPAGHGVVDNQLHVQGVTGLRVADNSVMPITPGNTRAMAISIGEALSELIISDIEA